VMMGTKMIGKEPFGDVYIHGTILDHLGRKMSKSLGNGIDPLDIIDSHGADAMRFTLVSMTTQTQDVRMPVEALTLPDGREVNSSPKFDIGRNFCNKLWNAARFAMMNLRHVPAWEQVRPTEHLADRWILSRLNTTIRDATRAVDEYRFNELADGLFHFMWDDLCDWYLEIAKTRIAAGELAPQAVLAHSLDVLLRMLHPIMPFITEELWRGLGDVAPHRGPGSHPAETHLVRAEWPRADSAMINPAADADMTALQEIIRQVRNARTEHGVPPRDTVDIALEAAGDARRLIADNLQLIRDLAQAGEVTFREPADPPLPNAAAVVAGNVRLYVLGVVDTAAETARLTKQLATLEKGVAGIEGKLANAKFLSGAPDNVVAAERQRLEKLQTQLQQVRAAIEQLK